MLPHSSRQRRTPTSSTSSEGIDHLTSSVQHSSLSFTSSSSSGSQPGPGSNSQQYGPSAYHPYQYTSTSSPSNHNYIPMPAKLSLGQPSGPYDGYATATSSNNPFDPESGSSSRSSAPTRLARRLLGRRGRWVAGAILLSVVLYYLHDTRSEHGQGQGGDELDVIHEEYTQGGTGTWNGPGPIIDDKDEEDWIESQTGQDKGKGKGKATSPDVPNISDLEYIVDEYGDHFYPSYPHPNIPPFDPDISLLPSPEDLFPEVGFPIYLRHPKTRVFPPGRIREVHNPPPSSSLQNPPSKVGAHVPFPADAFIYNWTGPEEWDAPRKQGRNVQFEGVDVESKKDKRVREARAQAVRRGFAHAWQGYKDHAWGHDEVMPVSKAASNPFNNWGATIIDSLDTLLVLGFNDEYNLCRAHVNQLKFEWVGGKDWKDGYAIPPRSKEEGDDEMDAEAEKEDPDSIKSFGRDRNVGLGVFETAIRYLGGLLGAYDLSGDTLMLERAVELADILKRAYKTQSGLPSNRLDPGSDADERVFLGTVSLAEVGTMTLELFRLSQITGDRQWHDLAQRTIDFLDTHIIPRSVHPPLIPHWFSPDSTADTEITGTFAWGGLADSYYEYLIKVYRLLGGSDSPERTEQYKRLYEESIDVSKPLLFWDIDVVPGRDLLAIGKWDKGRPLPEIEYLTCFAGAMMGLGAKLLDRPEDMVDAETFTKSCYWLSAATPTGLQPEVVEFYDSAGSGQGYENVSMKTGLAWHPHVSKVDVELEMERGTVQKDGNGAYHWTSDWSEVDPELPLGAGVDRGLDREEQEPQGYYQKVRGVPAGTKSVIGRGINRPETIESIFYMYRLTGDRKWQDRGWKMFVSWMQAAKVEGGISSIYDVTREKDQVQYGDNMESFTLAETFKYHYLLQADMDLISLDDYVFNTEAHPLLSNPNHKPGHSGLWTPPSPHSPLSQLGTRGEGTSAQKWTRYAHLEPLKAALRAAEDRGDTTTGNTHGAGLSGHPAHPGLGGHHHHHPPSGGKGMGGGGGKPGEKPKLPPEFYMRPDIVA